MGEEDADEAAERSAEQDHAGEAERGDERLHVLQVDEGIVAGAVHRLLAAAPAPEVQREHPPVASEARGDAFEVPRVAGEAGDAEDRGAPLAAGIAAIVEAEAVRRLPSAVGKVAHPALRCRTLKAQRGGPATSDAAAAGEEPGYAEREQGDPGRRGKGNAAAGAGAAAA